jgi:starch synthase
MEILLVSEELSPYTGDSPVGECVAALGRALCQLGHAVTVAMGKLDGFERHGIMVARRLTPLLLGEDESVIVHDGQLPSGVRVVLFERARGQAGPAADLARGATLCRAARAFAAQRSTPFDVIHAHGTSAAAATLSTTSPSVFTFYDPRDRGELAPGELDHFALAAEERARFELGTGASLLLGGMLSADAVVTYSAHLAEQALRVELVGAFGARLEQAGVEVAAIPGGLDYAVYNPATDAALAVRYDREAAHGKSSCKAALCRELELSLDAETPLLVFAQPLSPATGADLVHNSVLELCRAPVQLVVAGTGDAAFAFGDPAFARLSNFRYLDRFNPEFERRLNAAADLTLLPSRDPVIGTSIRVAQRYGSVPVALATPVARDAIVDADVDLSSGTGFLFDAATALELQAAVSRALGALRLETFPRFRRRVMGLELGWERSARRYCQIYKSLSQERAAGVRSSRAAEG